MRRVELGLLTLLVAVPALAHGLHVVRGELIVEPRAIVLDIETTGAHAESERCLRLLNELELRDAKGVRLVGRERDAEQDDSCALAYALENHVGPLSLSLRPRKRQLRRNERLVLQRADAEPLVLTNRGNVEHLSLR